MVSPSATPRSNGLTQRLAEYVAGHDRPPLTPDLQRTVRNGFIDTVAVMVAGRDEPVARIVRQWVLQRSHGATGARLLLGAERASARDAALVNATAAHALDYDDVGLQGHPSAVLVPALMAEGERLGCGGAALMAAYVVGHQTWAELISRDADVHHLKGWHPTGVFGTVAVAAAVAALRGMAVAPARNALGLAATMAAGLIANFGSMAKPLHAGNAAAHGIDAVDLAAMGMTAAPDALERPNGFLQAISPAGRVNLGPPAADFGAVPRLAELGLTIKKYPMCFATHRIIDAALDLARAHEVSHADVRTMQASIGAAQAAMLRNPRPTSGLEGKFSLQFAVAAPIVARACGLAQLQDDFVRRPEVQALFDKLRTSIVDTQHPTEPTLAASDRLVIELNDGRVLDSGEVRFARGEPVAPLGDAELATKFMDCTSALPAARRRRLLDSMLKLELLASVAEID